MDITLNIASITSTDDLKKAVEIAINESGMTKTTLASELGTSRQGLNQILNKKQFSLDDANAILNVLQYKVSATIEKMWNKKYCETK